MDDINNPKRRIVQLTIRGFGRDLERKIRDLAIEEGISLNQAVLRLLRMGAGIDRRHQSDNIGDSLDDLAGTWTADQERQFLKSIAPFSAVDDELWKRKRPPEANDVIGPT